MSSASTTIRRIAAKASAWEDRFNLRQQIGAAASLLCFVIVIVLAVGAASVGRNEALSAATADLRLTSFAFADRIDRGIVSRLAMLASIASLEPLNDVWTGPPPGIRATLTEARNNLEATDWIGFANASGIVVAAAGGFGEGTSVAKERWFVHGRVATAVEDATGEKPVNVAAAPIDEVDPHRFIDIGVPVRSKDGRLLGVIGLHVGKAWAERLRRTTIATAEVDLSILRSDGRIAFGHTPLAEILQGERVALVAPANPQDAGVDATGNVSEFAVTRGSTIGLGWLVVARTPSTVAYASANRVVSTIIALGVLCGIAGICGSLLIAGRVSGPFHRLAVTADQIGRDPLATLPRVRGSAEAVNLSAALRSLVLRLGSAERTSVEIEVRAADEARRLSEDIAVLRNLADLDTLTSLLNRRAFMEQAKAAMNRFWVERESFAVLMIDIDHFKRINDTHGHIAGDQVIRKVAETIDANIRPEDRAARFGGEEFVVLLRHSAGPEAAQAAERIRVAVAELPIASGEGVEHDVTVSVGAALASESDTDEQALIERADLALYAAKGAGRDRVAFAPMSIKNIRRSA